MQVSFYDPRPWMQKRFDKVTYNPFCFQLAMNMRGLTIAELSNAVGIKRDKVKAIINGDIECSDEHIERFSEVLDFPKNFFKHWYKTRIEIKKGMGENVVIDYTLYKIMN